MSFDFAYRPDEGLPAAAYDRLRADGPVAWSDALGGWLVSSYDGVKTVLSEPQRFTSEGTPVEVVFGPEAMLVNDTPLHHVMRAVWAKRVSLGAMAERKRAIEDLARRSLEPAVARMRAGEAIDLMAVLEDFTAHGVTWMFEVPDHHVADLKRWNSMMSDTPAVAATDDSPEWRRHLQAKTEVYAFIDQITQDRRDRMAAGEALDDLVSLMVAAEDGKVTRQKVADNLMNFFLGAIDTTSKWIANIVVFLDQHPELKAEVRGDPQRMSQVREEVMRLETVAQTVMRVVRDDTELGGRKLKAKDPIFVLLGAANRDPEVFDDPDRFDPERKADVHMGFGYGLHHCLGVGTARQETNSFLEVLYGLAPDLEVANVVRGPSWALWGPKRLDVRLGSR